jgi:hypothetical protein
MGSTSSSRAGSHLALAKAQVLYCRSELPDPEQMPQPLYPLILLYPRPSFGSPGHPSGFLPAFHTTYWLNGHNFIEVELKPSRVQFRKNDNAFLSVSNPKALQAAADRLSPQLIRQRFDYWTFLLGPKFSERERKAMNLHRFYAIGQIEYCRNFIFKRNFPIRNLFSAPASWGCCV